MGSAGATGLCRVMLMTKADWRRGQMQAYAHMDELLQGGGGATWTSGHTDWVSPSGLKALMDQLVPIFTRTFNSSLEKCHPPTPQSTTFRGSGIISVPTKPSITALNDRPASLEDWEHWWITAPGSFKLSPLTAAPHLRTGWQEPTQTNRLH